MLKTAACSYVLPVLPLYFLNVVFVSNNLISFTFLSFRVIPTELMNMAGKTCKKMS